MELLAKLIKFCLVGFSGMLIDFGVTFLCKEKLRINKYVANSLGFCVAASSNYLFNRIWTFHSHGSVPVEYAKFFGIAIVGLGINNLFLYLLTDKIKLNFYLSKLLAIGVVTFWNFFANYFFTFTVS